MAAQFSQNDFQDLVKKPQTNLTPEDFQDLVASPTNPSVKKTLSLTQNSPWGLEMNMAATSPFQTNIANNIAQGAANTVAQPVNLGIKAINSIENKNIPLVNPTIQGIKTDPSAVNASTAVLSAIPAIVTDGALSPSLGFLGKVGLGTALGATQGALGAANNPNASVAKNTLLGGFMGLGGSTLAKALSGFMESKGAAAAEAGSDYNTPEQAEKILTLAKSNGMNPDIGTLTNSSGLSSFYNDVLGSVPFSGIGPEQKNIVGKTNLLADQIMDSLKGISRNLDENGNPLPILPGDIGDHLKTSVASNMEAATQANKAKFNEIWNQADNQGLSMSPSEFPNTAAVAKKLIGQNKTILGISPTIPAEQTERLQNLIKANPMTADATNHIVELNGEMPEENIDSALNKSDMNSISDNTIQSKTSIGDSEDNLPLGNIHKEISDIGDKARQAAQTGDMKTASFYTSIKNAMTQDLNNKMASIPGLGDAYKAAKQDFADNVVPYRQQSILNILNNKTDANGLPGLLTKTNNKKIFQDLDLDDQNKVIYTQLKGAAKPDSEGGIEYTPAGIVQGYKNIQKNLPSYIMNDGAASQLDNLAKLNNMYKSANANVNTPLTGFRGYKKLLGLAALGLAGGGSHFIGADPTEAIASSLALPLAARAAGKVLRSNTLSNSYINPNGNIPPGILRHPLVSALLNKGQGQPQGGQQ